MIQDRIRQRLSAYLPLMAAEPDGLGFNNVYAKWLRQEGPGAEPDAFTTGGRIKPAIVVLPGDRNPHPSPTVVGWSKWDHFVSVYLFHYPGDHGKGILEDAVIETEKALTDPTWILTLDTGEKPIVHGNPNETHIDDPEQFPGNYVIVLRFRVTGLRSVPV